MRKTLSASKPFLLELLQDLMMITCVIAPIFMGVVFKFSLPYLESLLCSYFVKSQIIAPYYRIFDIILAIMSPTLFCFAGVLTMLDEFDSGIARYYFVTPVGKMGYLSSRLFLPAILAILYNIVLLLVFTISNLDLLMILTFALCGGLIAVINALFVIAYAKNKLEGMALIKLSGLLIVGTPVAYFVNSPVQYIFWTLPSFWLAKLSIASNYSYIIPTVATSLFIISALYIRFEKRLSRQG